MKTFNELPTNSERPTNSELPTESVMMQAFLRGDASFDGIFITAVRTTGIFCRPTCTAKKPRPENVQFYGTTREALLSGYRPCKRCRPLEAAGEAPAWLRPLLADLEQEPTRRWRDRDLRERGLSPERVRRWFHTHHGMTFHAYSRARRLGSALGQVQEGSQVTRAAFESGYGSLSGFNEAFQRYFGASPTDVEGSTTIRVDRFTTPLGPMLVGATDSRLCLLEFVDRRMLPTQVQRLRRRLGAVFVPDRNDIIDQTEREIGDYFEGTRKDFTVPIVTPGTEFQEAVWSALSRIPYGQTVSYRDLAEAVGRPAAVRAVGTTNGLNALAIIVPCHRVIGADGKLVGYGGGLWRKKRLLELEIGVATAQPG
jgi:AraC family transcriptional regulator of adaptative response/methylated-DNA-[protein]-cysteine methyltransferase